MLAEIFIRDWRPCCGLGTSRSGKELSVLRSRTMSILPQLDQKRPIYKKTEPVLKRGCGATTSSPGAAR
jgi:hypothetical protein